MLNSLRRSASGWMSKGLLLLLVLAFASWGVADVFTGVSNTTVMRVGDAEISASGYQAALVREINTLSQRTGRTITLEDARTFGVDRLVLGRMASDASLDHQAESMGIGLSDDKLAARIADDPAYEQMGGGNPTVFRQALQFYGLTEAEFVEQTRQFAQRGQLIDALASDLRPPQVMLQLANHYANEERIMRYIRLGAAGVEVETDPDAETLQGYFDNNTIRYRAPERRGVRYVRLDVDALADPASVTDAELREAYEAAADSLRLDERRTVVTLRFDDTAAAAAALVRAKGGEALDILANDETLGGRLTRLNTVTLDDILDGQVAEAAFGLTDTGLVPSVVDGRFGPVLVAVETIEASRTQPIGEVEAQLRQDVATRKAGDELFAIYDNVEDAVAGGTTVAEIASRFDLPLVELDGLSQNGLLADGIRPNLPNQDEFITAIFESDVGLENEVIELENNGFLWFDVSDVTPARDQTLDEVRERVLADWRSEAVEDALREKARELATRLQDGESIDAIASEIGAEALTTFPLKRATADADFGETALLVAFDGGEGHTGQAPSANNQARLVFVVENVNTPTTLPANDQEVQQVAEGLEEALQNGLLTDLVSGLQNDLGIAINEQLLGQLASGTYGQHQGM